MSVLLVLCGALAMALPGAGLVIAGHGRPGVLARLGLLALILGWALVLAGLGLAVAVGVVHLVTGTSLLVFEGHLAPGGIIGSALSAMVLMVAVTRAVHAVRREQVGRRLARPDGWLGHHRRCTDHDLVVLPTDDLLAYSVEGDPPQVVVSWGLMARLDADLTRFVIEHERAHLRNGHRRALFVATVTEAVFGAMPFVTRSTATLRIALECAADEEAAGANTQHRNRVAAGMKRLTHELHPGACGIATLPLRARRLLVPPAHRASVAECGTAAGLVALGVVALAIMGHVASDVPPLMAMTAG